MKAVLNYKVKNYHTETGEETNALKLRSDLIDILEPYMHQHDKGHTQAYVNIDDVDEIFEKSCKNPIKEDLEWEEHQELKTKPTATVWYASEMYGINEAHYYMYVEGHIRKENIHVMRFEEASSQIDVKIIEFGTSIDITVTIDGRRGSLEFSANRAVMDLIQKYEDNFTVLEYQTADRERGIFSGAKDGTVNEKLLKTALSIHKGFTELYTSKAMQRAIHFILHDEMIYAFCDRTPNRFIKDEDLIYFMQAKMLKSEIEHAVGEREVTEKVIKIAQDVILSYVNKYVNQYKLEGKEEENRSTVLNILNNY